MIRFGLKALFVFDTRGWANIADYEHAQFHASGARRIPQFHQPPKRLVRGYSKAYEAKAKNFPARFRAGVTTFR